MSEFNDNVDHIREKVLDRVAEEKSTAPVAEEESKGKIPLNFIKNCLFHNRMGDATLFEALHRNKYLYVKRWGRWLYWNGHHWVEDIENLKTLRAVTDVCTEYERILVEDEKAEKGSELVKLVRRRLNALRDIGPRQKLLECALLLDKPMYIEGNELDKQEFLLACSNGVVDLRTGELSQGKPDQYLLNHCPTEYKGLKEKSEAFMQFLYSSFDNDEEMVKYMLRLLGYALLGSREEHIWAIWHGPRGRNGKDTLLKIILKVIGNSLAIRIPTAMLMQQTFQRSGSQPEPDIMALRGAKFAFASEGESSQQIAMAKLKDLTGGTVITARGIQDKLMTSWDQTHLLFFLTNELPKMKAEDDAFWTRLHAIHWPIRFVDNPKDDDERARDPKMYAKLEKECSGILARLVEGCIDYIVNGLNPPQKVLNYTQEQRDQFDDIGQFVDDCCELVDDDNTRVQVSSFVSVLNWWRKKALGNSYAYSPKSVTQSLERRGINTKKSSVMFYVGVYIKQEVQEEYTQDLSAEQGRR